MSMESSSLAPDEGVELVQQPEEGTWKNAPAAAAGRLLMSLLPTRGVGFVIAGLLFLVMLVGTWWIHLNLDAPFLLGSHSFDATRRHARLPHRARSATPPTPTPLACNDTAPRPTCRAAAVPLSPSPPPLPSTSPPPLPSASPPPLPSAFPPPLPSASPPPLPSSPLLPSASPPPPSCPSYFRYIHSDLRPWSAAGITRDAVERGKPHAEFRLVVVGGRAYVETYRRSFQTRDVVTQWGIAQLLRRYPGRVPDLDLMFDCDDKPVVRAADYARTGMPSPPPLFRYCKDPSTIDILFPDWSFWGWPEINIRPWGPLMEEMKRENERVKWPQRAPYAYWKGNPHMSWARREVLRCNVSKGHEWNVRAFEQHWSLAIRNRFRDSNVAKQCLYRYKIYVEGKSWSVSEKYILACDSPMLLVTTPFQDFFSRGLVAGEHYWPISRKHICRSIKFAVDWGNKHQRDAQMMGEQGSGFAGDELSMDRVYDYMLHVLTEYAKLLRYKPTVPEKATELSPESMASHARGLEQAFMMESMENYAADHDPCVLPPPFMAEEVRKMAERAEAVRSRIAKMEKQMVFR